MESTTSWVSEELKGVNLGDARLNKRCQQLVSTLSNHPQKSLPKACKGWAETLACYRFFDNPKVNPDKILTPHKKATLKRIAEEKVVLMLQDTTEMNFSHREKIEGMGRLSRKFEQGFYLHPTLAVTPERISLGVLEAYNWARSVQKNDKAEQDKKPIEKKESCRWLNSYRLSNEIAKQNPKTLIVNVADREADIYELFLEKEQEENNAHWLIRAFQNRRLVDTETEEAIDERLYETVKSHAIICEYEFELPASSREHRKARKVIQEVRAGEICLRPPKKSDKKYMPVTVNFVYCTEKNPSKEGKPIEWLLLTSLPVEKGEDALKIVQWYLCRWQIEVFFKVLKTGCEIEELQLESYDRILNCLSLYLIVAWRVLSVMTQSRENSKVSCEIMFEKDEWQAVYAVVKEKKPPKNAPSLNEMVKLIASLGGFLGRKSDGEPGPESLWVGMQRMKDFAIAWPIFRKLK